MARAKYFTKDEDNRILFMLELGWGVTRIARQMERNRTAIYKRIDRMKKSGAIDQLNMDLGDNPEAGNE